VIKNDNDDNDRQLVDDVLCLVLRAVRSSVAGVRGRQRRSVRPDRRLQLSHRRIARTTTS